MSQLKITSHKQTYPHVRTTEAVSVELLQIHYLCIFVNAQYGHKLRAWYMQKNTFIKFCLKFELYKGLWKETHT
jgi:hypothetical protein